MDADFWNDVYAADRHAPPQCCQTLAALAMMMAPTGALGSGGLLHHIDFIALAPWAFPSPWFRAE
jgi:hypothetical protein